jgi:hypothetical protein
MCTDDAAEYLSKEANMILAAFGYLNNAADGFWNGQSAAFCCLKNAVPQWNGSKMAHVADSRM